MLQPVVHDQQLGTGGARSGGRIAPTRADPCRRHARVQQRLIAHIASSVLARTHAQRADLGASVPASQDVDAWVLPMSAKALSEVERHRCLA